MNTWPNIQEAMREGGNKMSSKNNLLKKIRMLGSKYETWRVFSDFCELVAITISNSVDKTQWQEREERYLTIVKQYEKEEVYLFASMFGDLVIALQTCADNHKFEDILGKVFHELELHNKWKGQFFTPSPICDAMAQITLQDCNEIIEKEGYITVNEPCIGSGAIVLGVANVLIEKGYNPSKHMVVTGMDIDSKCAHMAYIQLSLYGIPAVVVHGDTLSLKTWSTWITPIYLLNNFKANEVSA